MTAQEQYEQKSIMVKRTLNELQKQLKLHKQEERKDPNNWGFAGEMENVQQLLNEALEFLAG